MDLKAVEFIGQVAKIIAQLNAVCIRRPVVDEDYRVCVVVQDTMLENVQKMVKFETSVGSGECCDVNICVFGFNDVMLFFGVEEFKTVVVGRAWDDIMDFDAVIVDKVEELTGVADFGLEEIVALTEFTPQTIENEFDDRAKARVAFDGIRIEMNAFMGGIVLNVLKFVVVRGAIRRPVGSFLFGFEEGIDKRSEQSYV